MKGMVITMKSNKSRYLKNYFKHNGIVLICELLIVLLLSLVCTLLLKATPVWFAPVMALAAYLLAELRFMMAYIAKCVKRDYQATAQPHTAQEEAPTVQDDFDADDADEDPADERDDEEEEPSEFLPEDGDSEYEFYDDQGAEEQEEELPALDVSEDEVSDVSADDEAIDTFDQADDGDN